MLEDLLQAFLVSRRALDIAVGPDDLGQVAPFLRGDLTLASGAPEVDLRAHEKEGSPPLGVALDFRQPGVDDTVERLAVADREAQDQDFALLVCVRSQALVVTLWRQTKE